MRHFIIIAITLLLLGACGQTGPLYTPDNTTGSSPDTPQETQSILSDSPQTELDTTQ